MSGLPGTAGSRSAGGSPAGPAGAAGTAFWASQTRATVSPLGSPPHVWSLFQGGKLSGRQLTQGHRVSFQQGRAEGPAPSQPTPDVRRVPSPVSEPFWSSWSLSLEAAHCASLEVAGWDHQAPGQPDPSPGQFRLMGRMFPPPYCPQGRTTCQTWSESLPPSQQGVSRGRSRS